MATTVRQLNELTDRLTAQLERMQKEYATFPQQRLDAAGKAELLRGIEARKSDLETANEIRKEALVAWRLAAAALSVNPDEVDTQYAAALKLSADVQAIIRFRKKDKADDPATTADGTDTGDEGTGDKPAPKDPAPKPKAKVDDKADDPKDPAPKPDEGKGKGDKKADDPKDPILAAIAALGKSCDKNHGDALGAIEALKPGLIKPELATILNTLDAETLQGILNRGGLSPLGVELINVLGGYTPEELATMLANLQGMSGFRERLRRPARRSSDSPTPSN